MLENFSHNPTNRQMNNCKIITSVVEITRNMTLYLCMSHQYEAHNY